MFNLSDVLKKTTETKTEKKELIDIINAVPDIVAVLGGGAAGLFAASALCRKGHKVVLIEAQDRLGGRIYPITVKGFEIQLGATYLHDTGDAHNPNMLLSELKIAQDFEHFGRGVGFKSSDVRMVTENPKSQNFRLALNEMLEGCCAEKLSSYDREGLEGSYENGVDNFFLFDGYSALLKKLETELMESGNCYILKNSVITEVMRIEKNSHVLKIADGLQIHCKSVICALPVGVLQSNIIKFTPALPDVFKVINPGNARRLAIQFESQLLDPLCSHLILHETDTNTIFRVLNMDYYRKLKQSDVLESNCLVVTYVDASEAQKHLPLEAVVNKVKSFLKKQCDSQDGAVIDRGNVIAEHNWSQDRFCLGGWSSLNQTIVDQASFEDWFRSMETYAEHNHLYFAGEYMSRGGNGTVHGAALSGQQVAVALDKSLRNRLALSSKSQSQ
jgi:hypothetical protein